VGAVFLQVYLWVTVSAFANPFFIIKMSRYNIGYISRKNGISGEEFSYNYPVGSINVNVVIWDFVNKEVYCDCETLFTTNIFMLNAVCRRLNVEEHSYLNMIKQLCSI
jgi:hypothetical protein